MTWFLQQADDDAPDRFAGDTPVDSEGSQRDTREDVFKREHDELINSEAVQQEKSSRENLRRFVASEVERIKPRQEQYEAQQAARQARREQERQRSRDRAEAARLASEERRAQRQAEREEREGGATKNGRANALTSKQGGELKSYAKKSRAVYFIQQIRTDVERRYEELERDLHEQEKRTKEIDRELRDFSEEARDARHDFGEESRTLRRTSEASESDITREVGKKRQELFKQNAQLKLKANRLRAEKARLQATLNTKRTELKRFKRLVEQIRRVYENRNSTLTDPFTELERLHSELRRYKIYLPNLRLGA